MTMPHDSAPRYGNYVLPPLGHDPATQPQGTTPGSFARPPGIAPGLAGAYTFSSPDIPGMPAPSEKTAWDFMPCDWRLRPGATSRRTSRCSTRSSWG